MDSELLLLFNQAIAHPALDIVAVGLSTIGFMALPGLGGLLLLNRQRRLGTAILAALAISLLGVLVFQYVGQRPRPSDTRLILAVPVFPSFPSGHAAAAFSTATLLILASRQLIRQMLALLAATLIALSRLYLGVHYPTDVLGGIIFGAAVGAACYGLFLAPSSHLSRWRWLLWPQLAIVFVVSEMAYLRILPPYIFAFPYMDKLIHFLLFGALAFWLNLWLRGRTIQMGTWAIPLTLVILFTFATVEESSQALSPNRTLSWSDLLSNLSGLVAFWWVSQQMIDQGKSVEIGDS